MKGTIGQYRVSIVEYENESMGTKFCEVIIKSPENFTLKTVSAHSVEFGKEIAKKIADNNGLPLKWEGEP